MLLGISSMLEVIISAAAQLFVYSAVFHQVLVCQNESVVIITLKVFGTQAKPAADIWNSAVLSNTDICWDTSFLFLKHDESEERARFIRINQ